MNKHYTSGMTMRESRPRSKRLLGIGSAGRSVSYVSESGEKYTLPPATNNTLGGVKVGSGIHVEEDGTISTDATKTLRIRIYRDDTTHAWTLDESEMTGQEMCDFFSEGNESAQIFVDTGLSETSVIYPAQLVFPGMNHVIVSAVVQSFIEYGIRKTTYEVELDGQDAASVSVSTSEKVSQTLLIRLYKDSTTHAWTLDESEMTGQEMCAALGSGDYRGVEIVLADWFDGDDLHVPATYDFTGANSVTVEAKLTGVSSSEVAQEAVTVVLDGQEEPEVSVASASFSGGGTAGVALYIIMETVEGRGVLRVAESPDATTGVTDERRAEIAALIAANPSTIITLSGGYILDGTRLYTVMISGNTISALFGGIFLLQLENFLDATTDYTVSYGEAAIPHASSLNYGVVRLSYGKGITLDDNQDLAMEMLDVNLNNPDSAQVKQVFDYVHQRKTPVMRIRSAAKSLIDDYLILSKRYYVSSANTIAYDLFCESERASIIYTVAHNSDTDEYTLTYRYVHKHLDIELHESTLADHWYLDSLSRQRVFSQIVENGNLGADYTVTFRRQDNTLMKAIKVSDFGFDANGRVNMIAAMAHDGTEVVFIPGATSDDDFTVHITRPALDIEIEQSSSGWTIANGVTQWGEIYDQLVERKRTDKKYYITFTYNGQDYRVRAEFDTDSSETPTGIHATTADGIVITIVPASSKYNCQVTVTIPANE